MSYSSRLAPLWTHLVTSWPERTRGRPTRWAGFVTGHADPRLPALRDQAARTRTVQAELRAPVNARLAELLRRRPPLAAVDGDRGKADAASATTPTGRARSATRRRSGGDGAPRTCRLARAVELDAPPCFRSLTPRPQSCSPSMSRAGRPSSNAHASSENPPTTT